jgi:iron complex outermembrane receptor protein
VSGGVGTGANRIRPAARSNTSARAAIGDKPEKSKTFSAGIVIEPTKSLTVSLDYFQIKLRDKIGTVAEQALFGNYDKYKDSFVYSADGNSLDYVVATLDNLGEMHTSGVDRA